MKLTPELQARQLVAPIIDTNSGQVLGVAYGLDGRVTRWKPEQADELEAVGLLMIELAEKLREAAEGDGVA